MARIETDPNYSTPTFSRATAATDLFKKEDVQNLAAAMSAHVHDGSGKGLQIAALPAGIVTSLSISDGTIIWADIQPGSLYSWYEITPGASSPTTTSTAMVDMPDMVVNYTSPTVSDIRVDFHGIVFASAAGVDVSVSLVMDSSIMNSALALATYRSAGANLYMPISLHAQAMAQAAAAHTCKVQWSVSSGTLTAFATYRYLSVEANRR